MLRVTADSNIYISALNFGGLPDKVLDLSRSGEIQLAVSEAILVRPFQGHWKSCGVGPSGSTLVLIRTSKDL